VKLREVIGVVAIAAVLLTYGCGRPTPQTDNLRATLKGLALDSPAADLDRNLRGGDKRFIGINGYTCVAPGVAEDDVILQTHGVHCLEGTSDALEGSKHRELVREAEGYARAYNAELLHRIRAGAVT
jgi:hypothetical protein